MYRETPKSGTKPHREAAALSNPNFYAETTLALNSEGLDVPKYIERWGENNVK